MTHLPVRGESDLATLLRSLQPEMDDSPYVFSSISREGFTRLTFFPLCGFSESEGVTVIATQSQAKGEGWPLEPAWARITLTVHSSLQAVGFLAAIASALAREGISVNPVSAYYHDHLFVPWERRLDAMEILNGLSRA
jgi:hypothetical protein